MSTVLIEKLATNVGRDWIESPAPGEAQFRQVLDEALLEKSGKLTAAGIAAFRFEPAPGRDGVVLLRPCVESHEGDVPSFKPLTELPIKMSMAQDEYRSRAPLSASREVAMALTRAGYESTVELESKLGRSNKANYVIAVRISPPSEIPLDSSSKLNFPMLRAKDKLKLLPTQAADILEQHAGKLKGLHAPVYLSHRRKKFSIKVHMGDKPHRSETKIHAMFQEIAGDLTRAGFQANAFVLHNARRADGGNNDMIHLTWQQAARPMPVPAGIIQTASAASQPHI